MLKYASTYLRYIKNKHQKKTSLMMILRFLIRFFFSDFFFSHKGICCGYSFELHRQVDAIQMSTRNICLYKEVDKKYTGCKLKTTELLDCALIGVCAVIRLNTVYIVGESSVQNELIFRHCTCITIHYKTYPEKFNKSI